MTTIITGIQTAPFSCPWDAHTNHKGKSTERSTLWQPGSSNHGFNGISCCDKAILLQEGSTDPVEFVCEQFTKKGFISYFIPKKLHPGLVGIVLLLFVHLNRLKADRTEVTMAEDQFESEITSAEWPELTASLSPCTSSTHSCLCQPGFQCWSLWVRNFRSP